MPYRCQGVINGSKKWDPTPKREAALKRVAELKVDIYSIRAKGNGNDYTLLVPHNLASPEYIEIGYLIAQLGDEQFPENMTVCQIRRRRYSKGSAGTHRRSGSWKAIHTA